MAAITDVMRSGDRIISVKWFVGGHEKEHGFPAEHAPISDGTWTEAIFFYDTVGRFAAHDTVR